MTKGTKDKWLSILRTLVTAAGSFFAGKMLFGTTIDNNIWLGLSGAVLAVAAAVWGVLDKTVNQEMVLSAGRSVFTSFGPLAVGAGWVTNVTLEYLAMAFSTIVPAVMSNSEGIKNRNIATGKTAIADLKGVDETKPELITPSISVPNTPDMRNAGNPVTQRNNP